MSWKKKPNPIVTERSLQGWRFLQRFREVLARVREGWPRTEREDHGLRQLQAEGYLSLFLLAMFNPVLSSMRALCQASRLPRVQEECGQGPVALSRFSEAQAVFDPELLRRVLSELVEASAGQVGAKCGGFPASALQVVDSTLCKVVSRMSWATWRHQGTEQRAVRLHVKLRVWDEAPVAVVVTSGDTCERTALRATLRAGEIYVGDRNYGEDYGLLEEMRQRGCDFLVRLRNNALVQWETEEPLDEGARAAGITRAGQARLGRRGGQGLWRVLLLERPGAEPVLLVASACWAELSPTEIADCYRQRWKIEQFFRWLKCLVPCRHWFAESQPGVTFQVYLALIGSLLLAQTLGERPNKRMLELLHFYQMGWATEDEVAAGILQADREARRKRELAARKAAQKKST